MRSTTHVALLGGSFDPPHLGHVYAVNTLLNQNVAAQIWLLPSGARWDKSTQVESSHRVAMVRLLVEEFFEGDTRVRLCGDDASNLNPSSGTAGLLGLISARYPEHRFSFVIGHELIGDLPKWKHQEELRKVGHFIALRRYGTDRTEIPSGFDVTVLEPADEIGVAISSSALRARLLAGGEVRGLIPARVWGYITAHKLYGWK